MTYQNKMIGKKKIGILGGSFDPIHNGHLAIAQSAYQDFELDEIWLIPAGHSPNKDNDKMTSAVVRAQMTALAAQDVPHFKLSTYEIDKEGTSYTYLTLSDFKKEFPDIDFYFIMGADSLDYFETWKHPEIICQKATILVAVREEMDLNDIQQKIEHIKELFHAEIYPLSCPKIDISSSKIRANLQSGKNICDMVPQVVADYIAEHELYKNI